MSLELTQWGWETSSSTRIDVVGWETSGQARIDMVGVRDEHSRSKWHSRCGKRVLRLEGTWLRWETSNRVQEHMVEVRHE